jgi:hypothetical protein
MNFTEKNVADKDEPVAEKNVADKDEPVAENKDGDSSNIEQIQTWAVQFAINRLIADIMCNAVPDKDMEAIRNLTDERTFSMSNYVSKILDDPETISAVQKAVKENSATPEQRNHYIALAMATDNLLRFAKKKASVDADNM